MVAELFADPVSAHQVLVALPSPDSVGPVFAADQGTAVDPVDSPVVVLADPDLADLGSVDPASVVADPVCFAGFVADRWSRNSADPDSVEMNRYFASDPASGFDLGP